MAEKKADDLREDTAFRSVIKRLVPKKLRSFFPLPLDRLPNWSNDKLFWIASEKIGYMVYGTEAVNTNTNFKEIFIRDDITDEMKKFLSVQFMLKELAR